VTTPFPIKKDAVIWNSPQPLKKEPKFKTMCMRLQLLLGIAYINRGNLLPNGSPSITAGNRDLLPTTYPNCYFWYGMKCSFGVSTLLEITKKAETISIFLDRGVRSNRTNV